MPRVITTRHDIHRRTYLQADLGSPPCTQRREPSKISPDEKGLQKMITINCTECKRKLANVGSYSYLSIKCPRCKAVNTLRTTSSPSERPERLTTESEYVAETNKADAR